MLVKVGVVDLSVIENEKDRKLNVRINSDYLYKSIYQLDDGDKVIVIDRDDITDYYKILFTKKGEFDVNVGYVTCKYLNVTEFYSRTYESLEYLKLRKEPSWKCNAVFDGIIKPYELIDVLEIKDGWAMFYNSRTLCYAPIEFLKEVKAAEDYLVNQTTDRYIIADRVNKGETIKISEIVGNYGVQVIAGQKYYIPLSCIEKKDSGSLTDAEKIVALTKAQLGKPYKWGEEGPDYFDCSGLAWYVYKEVTGMKLPRVSRDMAKVGKPVLSKNDILPADLIFFDSNDDGVVNHVGVYIGDNMMIHSPKEGDVVKIANITSSYWSKRYVTARRFL